ncbi:hypothetical protein PG987_010906 [Apiospora arundinis]
MIMLLKFPLLLVLLALTPSRRSFAIGTGTCYKRDGSSAREDKNWAPCYPDQKASHCCSTADLCMSNGLCLDAGGDQYFSVQGCTNSDWAGCNEICNNTSRGPAGEGRVTLCSVPDAGGSMMYCCGACSCNGSNLPRIRMASDVFRPPQAASTSSSQPPTQTATHDNNTSNNSSSSNNNNNDGSNPHVLAIGLGVGIPLGLALIGGIIFLGLQLRKWTAAATQQHTMTEQTEGGGKTASVIGGSGGGGDDGGIKYTRQELDAGPGA